VKNVALFPDGEFAFDCFHAVHIPYGVDCLLALFSTVDETAERHFAVPGFDADIGALDVAVRNQHRFHLGSDDAVIDPAANGGVGSATIGRCRRHRSDRIRRTGRQRGNAAFRLIRCGCTSTTSRDRQTQRKTYQETFARIDNCRHGHFIYFDPEPLEPELPDEPMLPELPEEPDEPMPPEPLAEFDAPPLAPDV
jgi:hypothetical protein